jgi:transcriptional regulator with XRE-family HTH domain
MSSEIYSIDDLVERIKQVMTRERVNQTLLAKWSGLTNGYVSEVIRGKKKPNVEMIYAIAKNIPNISTTWLILGEGDMYLSDKSPVRVSSDISLHMLGVASVINSVATLLQDNEAYLLALDQDGKIGDVQKRLDVVAKALGTIGRYIQMEVTANDSAKKS